VNRVCANAGSWAQRVVCSPFLFPACWSSRIRHHTRAGGGDHTDINLLAASYPRRSPLVIDTFQERVEEVVRGDTQMYCSLCKYRAEVLGFETEVGSAPAQPSPPPRGGADRRLQPSASANANAGPASPTACRSLGHQAHSHGHGPLDHAMTMATPLPARLEPSAGPTQPWLQRLSRLDSRRVPQETSKRDRFCLIKSTFPHEAGFPQRKAWFFQQVERREPA